MRTFTIAAAQATSLKGDIFENVRRHTRLVAVAREYGADVVVFPELSLTGYEPTIAAETAIEPNDSVLAPLQELAEDSGVVILAGCPIRSASEKPYIGMLVFQPGQTVAVYRKRFVHSSEEPYFVASDDMVVFAVREMPIGVAICADIKQPRHAADAARLGAKVYAAGVATTPDETAEAATNMAAHAKNHGMLAVMANYASPTGGSPMGGHSAVWDETGRPLVRAEPRGEAVVLARSTPEGWAGIVAVPDAA